MENQAYGNIIGSSSAPYINSLLASGGLATNYFGVSHPSLPNYLALTGGSAFNIGSDCTTCWVSAQNIADGVEGVGKTWKAYEESMPSACFVGDSYPYMQKHDPFIYFNDIRTDSTRCQNRVVPYTQMRSDLKSSSTTPNFAFITPNMCNDMHDCAISTGDSWLQQQVPSILSSPAFTTQSSLLAITWDEDDSSAGNQVPLILLGGVTAGSTSSAAYNHYSLLHTIESGLGLPTLTGNDAGAATMGDLLATAPTGCSGGSVAANPTTPQVPGTPITFAASSSGCSSPQYEFWLQNLDGSWQLKQGWGSPNFTWNTAGVAPGNYAVHAWVSATGGPSYDSFGSTNATLTGCTSASLSAAGSTTGASGTVFSLTGSSSGCANPRYEFWIQNLDGSWSLKQGWGGPSLNLDSTGLDPGVYTVHVWAAQSPGTTYDAVGSLTLTVAAPASVCAGASLAPLTTTTAAGSTIALTASASCPTPEYEFWVQYPDGSWNLKQGWGGASFSWDTTGLAPGTYVVHAWVNASGTAHDSIGSATVTLTGCQSASLSPSSVTQPAGSTIAFTAISSGCLNPEYQFFVQYPDGTWHLKQGWGAASFNWNTGGLAPGGYVVHAWVNRSGMAWEAIGSATVTLSGCTAASLTPPSGIVPGGTVVNFVASGWGGCPNPVYRFFVQYPNGTWQQEQAWGGATLAWDTSAVPAGVYTVHAWANQQGAAPTLEVYGSSMITITGCTSTALTPPTPTSAAGSTIDFTASSSGCINPEYEFFVQYPDGSWHLKQGWGASAFNWDTTGLAPGAYLVHAWANRSGVAWDAIGSATVTLTGCSSAAVTPSSGTAAAGSLITFTANSSGCPTPVYEFWLQYPDGTWHLMQPFSTANTWTWNSTGMARGTYTIHVWTNNSGADTGTYEVIGSAAYSLS